jgi:hypothetical protein
MSQSERRMTGSSDSNRSEGQGGDRKRLSTKAGRSEGNDRRNTNRQRGRVREMSVLGNAKSESHRKTHQVEPGGTGPGGFMHLTRGDLRRESGGEVSRGHRSEETGRKAGGAKGRRTEKGAPALGLRGAGVEVSETRKELPQRQPATGANEQAAAGLRWWRREREPSPHSRAKEGSRRCSKK